MRQYLPLVCPGVIEFYHCQISEISPFILATYDMPDGQLLRDRSFRGPSVVFPCPCMTRAFLLKKGPQARDFWLPAPLADMFGVAAWREISR